MTDLREINRMTIAEYSLRMKAYRLRRLDQEYHIAYQAWMNREIQATRKKGKSRYESVYKDFRSFFDFESREKEILYGTKRENKPANGIASRLSEYMRMKHGND